MVSFGLVFYEFFHYHAIRACKLHDIKSPWQACERNLPYSVTFASYCGDLISGNLKYFDQGDSFDSLGGYLIAGRHRVQPEVFTPAVIYPGSYGEDYCIVLYR